MSHKVDNPFVKIEEILLNIPKDSYDAVMVEFHRETTAELYGMAHFLDGEVSVVYGTHTHIQTNDAHILSGGTGIMADVGMNGPFESVI
jgi:calcineurin-like phosphoesterase